jgi:carboxyl-terminal processing protease
MKNVFLIIALLICFLSPAEAQQSEQTTNGTEVQLTIEDLRTFTDVFSQLRNNFVVEIDDHTLLVAAIEGMISKLDPWSVFLDAEKSNALNNSSLGRYGGIGVSLDLRDSRLLVDSVTPGGPAERAGIRSGDLITSVGDKHIRGKKVFDSVNALEGIPGTEISVRVKSEDNPSRDLILVREFIPVTSLNQEFLEGGFGYLEVTHFHRNTHIEFEKGVASLKKSADDRLNGLIIDLRGNPGGVVLSAVEMADGFLDEGLIVFTQGRYEASLLEFKAKPGQWAEGVPVAILVNGKTASASEVFTGAMQDHGRAVVIGETTFGKGSIQSVFKLRNDSTLKLTTAHYFTPSGRTLHNLGIEPDIKKVPDSGLMNFATEKKDDTLVKEALSYFASLKH